MRQFHVMLPPGDVGDVAEEVRLLFEELDRGAGPRPLGLGEYTPPVDVVETDEVIQIQMDVPGVAARELRILLTGGVLVVAGHKPQPESSRQAATNFHLVERAFGRFARGVRLNGAFDAAQARASLDRGELIVIVPKILERRGRRIPVAIQSERSANR